LRILYVFIALFGLFIALGAYLIEPLLPLYLVFYRDLRLFYEIPMLSFVFFVSSSIARIFLAIKPGFARILMVISIIMLPLSILMYVLVVEKSVFIVRITHGFSLSVLITSMWINLLEGIDDLTVLRRCIGVYNAFLGLSTAITFILSYMIVLEHGFNYVFMIAISLCIVSFIFMVALYLNHGLIAHDTKSGLNSGGNVLASYLVFVIMSTVFIKNLGYGIVKPYFPTYIVLFFDHVILAWSVFVYAGISYVIGSMASPLILGRIKNTLPLLLLSLLGVCIGSLIYAQASTPEEFIVASIITTFNSAMYKVGYISCLSGMVSREARILVVIISLSLASLGTAIGSILSIYVGDMRLSFLLYSTLTLACVLVLLLVMIRKWR